MKSLSRVLLLALFFPFATGCANVADRITTGVEQGAERAAQREASRQADNAVTGVMRGVEDAVVCIVTDQECIDNARRNGEAVEVRDENGNVVETYPAPGTDVNVNPNFSPGSRTLFFDNYENDPVGDFPRGLEFVSGNWEVAEWQGRRFLRHTGPRGSAFRIVLDEDLPENFTIEMDLYFSYHNQGLKMFTQPTTYGQSVDFNYVVIDDRRTGVDATSGTGLSTSTNPAGQLTEGVVPFQMQVEGDYVKIYIGRDRVANIPNAYLPRTEAIQFEHATGASEDHPMYIGPIRVAAL